MCMSRMFGDTNLLYELHRKQEAREEGRESNKEKVKFFFIVL